MTLRHLFVDMNSFFASVEQQDDKKLRGKPVAVAAVAADTTCCLAASYEAKRCGIKTGTPIWEAKRLCPGLIIRVGRHDRYTEVHHQIVKAVGRCVPISRVCSIDEMACQLIGDERRPASILEIGRRIKSEIRDTVGDYLKCSVGAGPNVMLAKMAGDMQKPDGLVLLDSTDLPGRLYTLKLTDFPGIGPRMEKRLHKYGIVTVRQLLTLSAEHLSMVWGSKVHGERWYQLLRGEDMPDVATRRRTVGHSHVLPPELRTDVGAHGVFAKLLHKAAARLRGLDHWAARLDIGLRYEAGGRWATWCRVPRFQDTLLLLRVFSDLWETRPREKDQPKQVWLVLSDLLPAKASTPSLFPEDWRNTELSHVMDAVNRKMGKHSVRFGTAFGSEQTAPSRIAFNQIPEYDPAFGE